MTNQNESYDLVVTGGRVMDPETGLDAVRNVGIKDGRIVAITEQAINGKETIDATGHVVAPGFIDGHIHTVDIPLAQKIALRDGVTTTMDLEAGAMPVDRWYADLEGKSQTNYGASVSSAGARTATFDPDYLNKSRSANIVYDMMAGIKVTADTYTRVPNDAETESIMKMIETGLQEGGLGVGICPGYMVNGFSSKEMIGSQKLAGKYGLFSHVHGRFSSQMAPTSGLLAFQEAIASAGAFGGGVIIATLPRRHST
jgi:cytosine/adenosine deaminase-related metal-dependent hydrolase